LPWALKGLGHEIDLKKFQKKGQIRAQRSDVAGFWIIWNLLRFYIKKQKSTPIAYVYSPFLATITNYMWGIIIQ
jgi:hypothetical protein